jgi:hypothetical protein
MLEFTTLCIFYTNKSDIYKTLEGNNMASGYYTINIRIVLCNNIYKFTFILNNSSYTNILKKFTEFLLDVGSHTICPNAVVFIYK